jgi:hypothetical protein
MRDYDGQATAWKWRRRDATKATSVQACRGKHSALMISACLMISAWRYRRSAGGRPVGSVVIGWGRC